MEVFILICVNIDILWEGEEGPGNNETVGMYTMMYKML